MNPQNARLEPMRPPIRRNIALGIMACLLILVGLIQSWVVALSILQLCLISAIMALGVNIQWGLAGIFNVGIVGFTALGGLAALLVSHPPVGATISAGGGMLVEAAIRMILLAGLAYVLISSMKKSRLRTGLLVGLLIIGYFWVRARFAPAIGIIEGTDAAATGFLGGLGWPIWLSWPIGGALAGLAAWAIGKLTLGLRSDYLAIATLGISEIIVALIRNESWLTRGVKNVTGLPRGPIPYEIDLQSSPGFIEFASFIGANVETTSSILVKLCFVLAFALILAALLFLSERAVASPWGRMVRAIRDNRDAAEAMGKDVKARHLQIFIIGSVIVGMAGAMLTTLEGQLTPNQYHPLRFTFLIWVMVIVGGSGNNWGAILGGFFIWFFWIEAERLGPVLISALTFLLPEGGLKSGLIASAEQMRLLVMGLILIVTLRFWPRGILPERDR